MGKLKKAWNILVSKKWENITIVDHKNSVQKIYKLQAFEKRVYNTKQFQGSARTF